MATVTASRRSDGEVRRFSKREYYQMGELGFFRGQRVELLEGEIKVLSPQNAPHWTTVDRVHELLKQHFGAGYQVRMQGPVDLGQTTEPEPDVCVVTGKREDYGRSHPTTALLIVEVSNSKVSYDRHRKGSLYARAGIPDYWIVNLARRQVEVYRDPIPDASRVYGYRYATRIDRLPPATVSPLAMPQATIAVADLLP
jgi:Uma2 family endonuclease